MNSSDLRSFELNWKPSYLARYSKELLRRSHRGRPVYAIISKPLTRKERWRITNKIKRVRFAFFSGLATAERGTPGYISFYSEAIHTTQLSKRSWSYINSVNGNGSL